MESLSDADLPEYLEDSGVPVLIYFWAPWCNPCKAVSPIVQTLSDSLGGNSVCVVKVNVDEAPAALETHHVSSVPTLALIFRNEEIGRWSGPDIKSVVGLSSNIISALAMALDY